ncbi:uncharacterized protein ATC70_010767 [Mucor velutinosus]|uniref:Uncharacterized protein n=1 Tax=Mucor velutinosus TaxID=708070 RepID=A0AAN7I124_9FUNG|nr:hypothetical protein ATC70_010767 [Mucor velutinosus]
MPNTKNLENIAAPAQMVGGMRVKNPDAHRIPLKEEERKEEAMNATDEDGREVLSNEQQAEFDEQEKLRIRELQERQARDMENHTASKNEMISKNAGSNVKQQFIPPAQPRNMNH